MKLKRILKWLEMRSMESRIEAVHADMGQCTSEEVFRLLMAHWNTLRDDLVRIRADYNATFPPGVRQTWERA